MPSRGEIAKLLREAAPYLDEKTERMYLKCASQVENMHCENCEYFDDTPPTGCVYPWGEFNREGAAIDWCGTKFGCFSWEVKGDHR